MKGDGVAFARFCAGLPGFFRQPLEPAECRRRIVDGLADRETSFLRTIEHGIYAQPDSPYLRLLRHAGVELGDVQSSVRETGIEGTLERLYDEGVRVTLEEFKGVRPITRPGLELTVPPEDFDNPLLAPGRLAGETLGSRGVAAPFAARPSPSRAGSRVPVAVPRDVLPPRACPGAVASRAAGACRAEERGRLRKARPARGAVVLAEPARLAGGNEARMGRDEDDPLGQPHVRNRGREAAARAAAARDRGGALAGRRRLPQALLP